VWGRVLVTIWSIFLHEYVFLWLVIVIGDFPHLYPNVVRDGRKGVLDITQGNEVRLFVHTSRRENLSIILILGFLGNNVKPLGTIPIASIRCAG
jgi:hypothetical protein